MSEFSSTLRQRILHVLEEQAYSARELAEQFQIPIREVEAHLAHIVKTVAHQAGKRFCMAPSTCQDCGFTFRMRKRLTTPSRCPTCRSEFISPPRFRIAVKKKNYYF